MTAEEKDLAAAILLALERSAPSPYSEPPPALLSCTASELDKQRNKTERAAGAFLFK